MLQLELRRLRLHVLAGAFFVGAMAALVPGAPALAQGPGAVRGLPDFTDLVEQVGPSVVNIRTLEKSRGNGNAGSPGDEDMQEFFRRFFGVPMPNMPRQGPRPNRAAGEDEQPRGVGSGFILTGDGYHHDQCPRCRRRRRSHGDADRQARIQGQADRLPTSAPMWPWSRSTPAGLPAVKVGDVSRLKVGEWVMAIGSPFGLENTVTAGIVSAKQRDTGDYLPFIQTDVAINPGNSGGPLINMRGEVVGINSQIYSRSGGFMGISFAIPMDEAVPCQRPAARHGPRDARDASGCRSIRSPRSGRVAGSGQAPRRAGARR
jgi:serine protease Do